jgi:DNA-binding transcriptional LysR family regulator
MLDAFSSDQIRTFVAAAEEGSFSAAGRRLGRAQSVVSQTLANLEGQLGLLLFDRSARSPVLTPAGAALIPRAREIIGAMGGFKAKARALAGGLEPELSVAVDVMFPTGTLTDAVSAFHAEFPDTPLRLYVEALGAVLMPILDRRCSFGVMGSLPVAPPGVGVERLLEVEMVVVAAPGHPLAALKRGDVDGALSAHIQLILTDRSSLTEGREYGVLSPRVWRLADLGAKHAFLKAGLGWGAMPIDAVRGDIRDGSLIELEVRSLGRTQRMMTMFAAWRDDAPPGPAGKWFVERLKGPR